MSRVILYTKNEGGVAVCPPTEEIFQAMQFGGMWDHMPHGVVSRQIDAQVASGIRPDHARRYAYAVAFGGCSEAEGWEIIRDRDCARHGYLHELIDNSELPDRWFRDAWKRSENGGPVAIDLEKARAIQWKRLLFAVNTENGRRSTDLFGKAPIRIPRVSIQRAIKSARDEDELRRIWIEGVPT